MVEVTDFPCKKIRQPGPGHRAGDIKGARGGRRMFLNCPRVCHAGAETKLMLSTSHAHIIGELIEFTSVIVRTAWQRKPAADRDTGSPRRVAAVNLDADVVV